MNDMDKYINMKIKQIQEDIAFNKHWLEIYHIDPLNNGVEIMETKQLIKYLEYDLMIYRQYKERFYEN